MPRQLFGDPATLIRLGMVVAKWPEFQSVALSAAVHLGCEYDGVPPWRDVSQQDALKLVCMLYAIGAPETDLMTLIIDNAKPEVLG